MYISFRSHFLFVYDTSLFSRPFSVVTLFFTRPPNSEDGRGNPALSYGKPHALQQRSHTHKMNLAIRLEKNTVGLVINAKYQIISPINWSFILVYYVFTVVHKMIFYTTATYNYFIGNYVLTQTNIRIKLAAPVWVGGQGTARLLA